MAIRLNKAIRELNIGLQTAVEFLEKKKELGEVKPELAFKLNDAQYEALVEAFKQDKEVRTQADKLFRRNRKRRSPPSSRRQHVPKVFWSRRTSSSSSRWGRSTSTP